MAVAGCVIVNQSREAHVEMFPARWRRLALAGVTSITGYADDAKGTAYLPMHKCYI